MDGSAHFLYEFNMSRTSPILNLNLFGEAGDLPDVVHCETIETRSLLHDWEFERHRHARLHQVLFIEDGGGLATLDGEMHQLRPASFLNIPTGIVHGFTFDRGTSGLVVTLAAEMLDEILHPSEGLRPVLNRTAVWPASEALTRTMRRIAKGFASRDFARAQVLRSLAGLLLGQIAQALASREDAAEEASPDLFRRFEALLEKHFTEHWRVADYANALAISPTHLSRVAKIATGRPATRLIEERLVREACRNLVYTNLSVSGIAYALGFSDPAYFSRVFARATGLSPRKFRLRAHSPH